MSMYEMLGGEGSVAQAVDKLYARLQADPILGIYFQNSDVASVKSFQQMFLTAALGGPDNYQGRDMRAAHAHIPISDADFDLFMEHLAETLAELDTSPDRIDEVIESLSHHRTEIVQAPGDTPDGWGSQDRIGGSG